MCSQDRLFADRAGWPMEFWHPISHKPQQSYPIPSQAERSMWNALKTNS